MKFAKLIAIIAIALFSIGLVGCKGGVEGTYKLDKAEMKKAMEAEIKKMPKDQQEFAQLALALIDAMDMTMELKSGGKLEMKATSPLGGEEGKAADSKSKAGEWSADGDSVTLKMDGKETKCKSGGGKLVCEAEKKGEPGLVFLKSS